VRFIYEKSNLKDRPIVGGRSYRRNIIFKKGRIIIRDHNSCDVKKNINLDIFTKKGIAIVERM
jgi:hypothetical protein